MRVVDATNADMVLLLRMGGVHMLGEVTGGIGAGMPALRRAVCQRYGPHRQTVAVFPPFSRRWDVPPVRR